MIQGSAADRIQLTEKIFKRHPQRLEWMGLPAQKTVPDQKVAQVTVLRNTTFETVTMAAQPLLGFWGYKAQFQFSSYDTTFPEVESLLLTEKAPDLVVLWVDWSFLETKDSATQKEFVHKLFSRIEQSYSGPVALNFWTQASGLNPILKEQAKVLKKALAFDLDEMAKFHQIPLLGGREKALTTSCFSKEFDLVFARTLACSLIPSVKGFQLRGLILDLDQTMYQGVLGEDGLDGIQLSENHLALWKEAGKLKEQGVLLAIASKNNLEDVKELLAQPKIPLKAEDFAVLAVNWDSKVQNVAMILEAFNFSSEFVLFLDDNPNELISVATEFPELNFFRSDAEAFASRMVLQEYPGIRRFQKDEAAALRTKDIQANFKRTEMAAKMKESKMDYLRELQLKIEILKNQSKDFQRVADLAAKTNQFNLTFHRSKLEDLKNIVLQGGAVYSVSLSDRFSDSGVVGSAVLSRQKSQVAIHEFLFSCRALGREAETFFLQQILKDFQKTGVSQVEWKVVRGPKNQPALEWLQKLGISEGTSVLLVDQLLAKCLEILKDYPADLKWIDASAVKK